MSTAVATVDAARERPILFSAPMVRAILDGRKTQTRRIVKHAAASEPEMQWDAATRLFVRPGNALGIFVPCPYGTPGDRLWVKENFRLRQDQDDKPPSEDWWKSGAWFDADGLDAQPSGCAGGPGKLRPSIFMPRWASRIDLEITRARVERLHEIDEEDARAEGVDSIEVQIGSINGQPATGFIFDPRLKFTTLWDAINGERAPWKSNPWVWVVEFKRVRP